MRRWAATSKSRTPRAKLTESMSSSDVARNGMCEREDGGERREQPGNGHPSTTLGVTLNLSKGHETNAGAAPRSGSPTGIPAGPGSRIAVAERFNAATSFSFTSGSSARGISARAISRRATMSRMPHAEDAEPQLAHGIFGALDLAEAFIGHFLAVWNARRQAGRRGLPPAGQACVARQRADVVLRELRFVQRTAHLVLARPGAQAIVAAIVSVVAVDDDGKTAVAGDGRQSSIELVLAVITAVCVIERYSGRSSSAVWMISCAMPNWAAIFSASRRWLSG